MRVIVVCGPTKFEVPCGAGKQHIRWLGLVTATRLQREQYPNAFRVPQILRDKEGHMLKPRSTISEVLGDGDEVTVELRQGASIPEEEEEAREWLEEAYGLSSNLMECKFRWKGSAPGSDFPKMVRGFYHVAPSWQSIWPQETYGGPFEIPIEIFETGDPDSPFDWIASRKGPPGSCDFRFVMESGNEMICAAMSDTLDPKDKTRHHMVFTWDVPIAPEPFPEIDSRPSTASSRDGAQVDPRFEQDWESMRLRWVENYMKVRVKDVLTEFYAILIDLFDSYAFMGLDLSSSQHTIGMDDFKHLVLNCGLIVNQPEGSLLWRDVCTWFKEAAGVADGRPYLAQRLTRTHYLELLMRAAHHTMCVKPRAKYAPEPGRPPMPLDEALFRFITDILIPVMDVYDDDPIRKDAVQNQNLVVIQQYRPSIRSIYSFLAQPWPPCDGEGVVIPQTLKFVFEFTVEKLSADPEAGKKEAEGGEKKEGEAAPAEAKTSDVDFGAILGAEGCLTVEQAQTVLEALDPAIAKVTECHPVPPEQRALHFWEFFEVLMHVCRAVGETHETMPLIMATSRAVMELIDQGEAVLPDPPHLEGGDEDEDEEEEGGG